MWTAHCDCPDCQSPNPFTRKRAATRRQRLELVGAWLFFIGLTIFIFAVLAR